MRHSTGAALLFASLAGLPGCAAVSAISGAATPLDAYTLAPLSGAAGANATRHVVIEVPTASGAIATDRILVKPNRLQAAYLPAAAWADPAPEMIQTLLVQTLQASGAFRLVGRSTLGLFPDNTVLTEVRDFQAEAGPEGGPAFVARVARTMSIVCEADGAVVATRGFEATAGAADGAAPSLVAAFDAAMGRVLRQAAPWIAAAAGGGGGA
jgi:cholesterol transport system auxiliary component